MEIDILLNLLTIWYTIEYPNIKKNVLKGKIYDYS